MQKILLSSEENVNTPYLAEISEKDSRWDYHRSNTQSVGKHYENNQHYLRLAERMRECSTFLGFTDTVNLDTGELKLKLFRASFCHVRACPVCGWRRSLRNRARIISKMPELYSANPKARFLFLTLTVKNPSMADLRSTLKDMNSAWKKLTKRKEFSCVQGWIRSTEITHGKDGNPHPHLHILLMVKPSYFSQGYVSQERWSEVWAELMKLDYIPQVNVKVVRAKVEGQTIESAVNETLKYATKASDLIDDKYFLYGLTEQLAGLRFIASGGLLKEILKNEATDEEMIHGDEADSESSEVEKEVFFVWKPTVRKYQKLNQGAGK